MRVAVTGTDTALGRAVLQHLRVEQAVTSTVRVDLAEYDSRERLLPGILDGADVVVHCALAPALNRNDDAAFARAVHGCRNLGGMRNGLDIVAKIGRVSSSSSRARWSTARTRTTSSPLPRTPPYAPTRTSPWPISSCSPSGSSRSGLTAIPR